MLTLDLTDKLVRFPISYGYQPVKGFPVKHFDTDSVNSTRRTKQHGLGEGPWDACEKLWADTSNLAKEIPASDFKFHPGMGNDVPDTNFPSDAPHPWTSYISAIGPTLGSGEDYELFGIYRTLRTGNYNGAGQQINSAGAVVNPADPRDEYFFKPNPANASIDQIIRWGQQSSVIINWPAWVDWRDFNDELISWDNSFYTPRSLSLTPTAGGTLTPGQTYYVRVSTLRGGDESSASMRTLESKASTITLLSGQTSFQVNWLIKGDENTPATNPSGITGYRIYIGTVPGVWLGFFGVSNPSSRTFLITTTAGLTGGNPLDVAQPSLLVQIKRFECGLFFLPPYDLSASLDRICQISCSDWQWSGLGTNTFRNDKVRFMTPANRNPVFTLNLAETKTGTFSTSPVDRRNRPNQILVNFRDRDDEFLGEAQPVILDREQLQVSDKQVKPFTIDGGTMTRSQAQRVASFYARVLCDMDQISQMLASPKSYHILPGDVINVTNDTPDWTDVKFVVRKKIENVEKKDLGDPIISQLYTNDLYSDTDYAPLPRPLPLPKFDPFRIPPAVTSITLQQRITLLKLGVPMFNILGTVQFQTFPDQIGRLWWQSPSDLTFQPTETILHPDSNLQARFELRGIDPGLHKFKVVTESVLGNKLPIGAHPEFTIIVLVPLATQMMIFDNVPPYDNLNGLGLTVGVSRTGTDPAWFGSQIFRDRGYGYELVAPSADKESAMGTSTNNAINWLGDGSVGSYSIVWVIKASGAAFTNATLVQIGQGKNNYFIGREKIGVQTWTNMGNNLWKGENLVRGLNHTSIFQNTHTLAENFIQLDENIYFIPIEERDMNTTIFFKAVTYGLAITAAGILGVACRGDSVRSYAVDSLSGFKDTSGDWHISAFGNPRPGDNESYVARLRKSSNGALLRDLPIVPGVRMAAILGHIVHANGGGTWSLSTYAPISKNNIIGDSDNEEAAYVTQPFSRGGEINMRVTVTPAPAPFLTGIVRLSFGPSDFTDPFGFITGAILSTKDDNNTSLTRINVFDWSTNQYTFFDLPTVNGVVFVRIVWSGTELRWQFSGSPINLAAAPNAILKDVAPIGPTFLRITVRNGGPFPTFSAAKIENITIGGLSTPQTIYSLIQQQNDNGNNPILLGDLDIEFWQTSPKNPPDFKGFPVRKVF